MKVILIPCYFHNIICYVWGTITFYSYTGYRSYQGYNTKWFKLRINKIPREATDHWGKISDEKVLFYKSVISKEENADLSHFNAICLCVSAKSLQSCPTLCDPMECCLPDSSVHGILQARILESASMPSSRESSWPRNQTHVSYFSCIGRQVLYH